MLRHTSDAPRGAGCVQSSEGIQARSTKFTDERQSRVVTVHVAAGQRIERVMMARSRTSHRAPRRRSRSSLPPRRTDPYAATHETKAADDVRFVDGWSRMHLIEPRLDAVTCDARSIHDRARESFNSSDLPAHPRLNTTLMIVPVVDFVLGWFATAAPRNLGAAVALST